MQQKKNGKPRGEWQEWLWRIFQVVLAIHACFIGFILILCLFYNVVNPPVASLQIYRSMVTHHKVKPVKFVPLKQIPRAVKVMTVAVEDGHFYEHNGIDIPAIVNAYEMNRRLKRHNRYGGSTLTQQIARTLFLVPSKNLARKYAEAWVAIIMDAVMSKDRILELYLNYAEWGRGIFGIEAASRQYFGTSVRSLSHEQMVRLVTILSSPVKYGPENFDRLRILRERYQFLTQIWNSPGVSENLPGSMSNAYLMLKLPDISVGNDEPEEEETEKDTAEPQTGETPSDTTTDAPADQSAGEGGVL